MTVRLTEADFKEQLQEANKEELQFAPNDVLDTIRKFDNRLIQGCSRTLDLREGVCIKVHKVQNKDNVILRSPNATTQYIHVEFLLSGNLQARIFSATNETSWDWTSGRYWLNGTGSRGKSIEYSDAKYWSSVELLVCESVFSSFAASSKEGTPEYFQCLTQSVDEEISRCVRDIQPAMNTALHQILHCPYQGMVKRAYIESKAIELLALVLADEAAAQQGEARQLIFKHEQIERVYYAREILLRDMYNPPSLAELAQQAGLNEFTLKAGFRQVFGTTVFGELRAYRLEMAKQLLAEQSISVTAVAQQVGYGSARALARAFRQKFGIGPKAYQKICR